MIQSKVSTVLSKWTLDTKERANLDKYFILYWESEYFIEVSLRGGGKITREGIDYLTIYPNNTTPAAVSRKPVVALSFRKFKSMSYGYVLVRAVDSYPDSRESRGIS